METIEKRTSAGAKPEAATRPKFRPTLDGFAVSGDTVLVELIDTEESSLIARASAYAEPSLHGTVRRSLRFNDGTVVRFLKDVGTAIEFLDTPEEAKFLLIDRHDIVGWWDAPVPSA